MKNQNNKINPNGEEKIEIRNNEEVFNLKMDSKWPQKNFTPWYNKKYFVWKINYNYEFSFLSKDVKNILGYEPQELIGRNFFNLICIKNGEGELPSKLKAIDFIKLKLTFLSKDGSEIHLQSNIIKKNNHTDSSFGFEGISYIN